jgi:hypothetical protein
MSMLNNPDSGSYFRQSKTSPKLGAGIKSVSTVSLISLHISAVFTAPLIPLCMPTSFNGKVTKPIGNFFEHPAEHPENRLPPFLSTIPEHSQRYPRRAEYIGEPRNNLLTL